MIQAELLTTAARRGTVLPELFTFFRQHGGDRADTMLDAFLRTFSGAVMVVPGPGDLRSLHRDQQILESLRRDAGIRNQIKLLDEHGVDYAYMADLWTVCTGRRLNEPDLGRSRAELVKEAGELVRDHQRLLDQIISMYAITASERLSVLKEGRIVTQAEHAFVSSLPLNGTVKPTIDPKSIARLSRNGLIKMVGGGRVRCVR